MKTLRSLCAAAAIVAATTGVVGAGDTRVLVAYLNGANELPVLGDPDAFGVATVTLVNSTALCYTITVENLGAAATAAHIQTGNAGTAGGIFVSLPVNALLPFRISNCIPGLPAATITALRGKPGGFYVNVYTALFGSGAVRGQLQAE